jgi:hypothetical protein
MKFLTQSREGKALESLLIGGFALKGKPQFMATPSKPKRLVLSKV